MKKIWKIPCSHTGCNNEAEIDRRPTDLDFATIECEVCITKSKKQLVRLRRERE